MIYSNKWIRIISSKTKWGGIQVCRQNILQSINNNYLNIQAFSSQKQRKSYSIKTLEHFKNQEIKQKKQPAPSVKDSKKQGSNQNQIQQRNTEKKPKPTKKEVSKNNSERLLNIRCQGCNVILQDKDINRYGYISPQILKQALETNSKQIKQVYGQKAKSKEAKILDFMHEVQKETGIRIFNPQSEELENLDHLDVVIRLQEKIDNYEKQQQLTKRSKKQRKDIICFRCFSLKYHNRLPQQYDTNQGFTKDSTQFILNKVFNRHKSNTDPCQFFFMVDVLDLAGTFPEWLFQRLIIQGVNFSVVVNKIDIINKRYIDENLLHNVINRKIRQYLQNLNIMYESKDIKVFYLSSKSRDGFPKLKKHVQGLKGHIQLIGFPNTGKTTFLNSLVKITKLTSKIPGTTIKVTEHEYGQSHKRKIYDMPGLFHSGLLYNLITKPSIRQMLTWEKRVAPGILTHSAFIYGGKVQIKGVRIIVYGLGGACSSNNRWFLCNYKEFWKGLPPLNSLKIKKYEKQLIFTDGKCDDLQISGYGFIGFRICGPHPKVTKRLLTFYLPEQVQFNFRSSILSNNDAVFHHDSAVTKKYMLHRLTEKPKKNKERLKNKNHTFKDKLNKQKQNEQQEILGQFQQHQQQNESLSNQYNNQKQNYFESNELK